MLIHLVEAFIRSDQVNINESFEDFRFSDDALNYPIGKPLHCELVLSRVTKEEVSIKGCATLQLIMPCDRCAKEVAIDMNIDIHRFVCLHDEEDMAFLEGVELDVERFLAMELLSDFPQKVLCSEECKGLCGQCGANLNEQECSCDKGHIDIRLAHLKDLFNSKFKEV